MADITGDYASPSCTTLNVSDEFKCFSFPTLLGHSGIFLFVSFFFFLPWLFLIITKFSYFCLLMSYSAIIKMGKWYAPLPSYKKLMRINFCKKIWYWYTGVAIYVQLHDIYLFSTLVQFNTHGTSNHTKVSPPDRWKEQPAFHNELIFTIWHWLHVPEVNKEIVLASPHRYQLRRSSN